MEKTLEYYMNLPWITTMSIETEDGDPYFVAYSPEFGVCVGTGATRDEALQDLQLARRSILTAMIEHKDRIVEPDAQNMPETTFQRTGQKSNTRTGGYIAISATHMARVSQDESLLALV